MECRWAASRHAQLLETERENNNNMTPPRTWHWSRTSWIQTSGLYPIGRKRGGGYMRCPRMPGCPEHYYVHTLVLWVLGHGLVLYLASSTIVPPRNFPLLRDTGASVTSHSAVVTPCRFTQGFNGGMVCMFQLPRCSLGATRPRSSPIAYLATADTFCLSLGRITCHGSLQTRVPANASNTL